MDTTISNNYRRLVYFCYLPLAILPFAWVLGRELAINMIVSSPHRDFSIRLPFDLSHSFYLAVMCLFLGLGASTIKAFLDNKPESNLAGKLAFGLPALAVFILNACFMITSMSVTEMLIYIVMPITLSVHLMSLRREKLSDLIISDAEELLFEEDTDIDDSILCKKPVTLSVESNHYKATLNFSISSFFNTGRFETESITKYFFYALIGACFLPLCLLAMLSLPVLLTTLAAYIEPDLLGELTKWNYWRSLFLMYGLTFIGVTALAKMLSLHFRNMPITLHQRLSLTLMYLIGLSNLLMMWNAALEISTHHLLLLAIFGPPLAATIFTGILCSFSIWQDDTISVSEYFEMELGESLKNTTPPFKRRTHD